MHEKHTLQMCHSIAMDFYMFYGGAQITSVKAAITAFHYRFSQLYPVRYALRSGDRVL